MMIHPVPVSVQGRSWTVRCLGALGLVVMTSAAAAQSPSGIRVISNHQISKDNAKRPHFESHLAVDAKNPRHMLATAMVQQGERTSSFPYVTFDGGKTWIRGRAKSGSNKIFQTGDPLVYITRKGVGLYVGSLSDTDGSKTAISRSTDGGRTWSDPVKLPYRDRPWLGFDESFELGGKYETSPMNGTIYLSGMNTMQSRDAIPDGRAMVFSRSRDQGKTWEPGTLFTHDDGGPDPSVPIAMGHINGILVSRGGTIVMPYWGFAHVSDTASLGLPAGVVAGRIRILASDDGGKSFAAIRNGPLSYYNRTAFTGGGGMGDRSAIDISTGKFKDRIYIAYAEWDIYSKRHIVRLAYSSDFGKTWNTTTVSDDNTGSAPGNPAVAGGCSQQGWCRRGDLERPARRSGENLLASLRCNLD
jgi:hypothetical protein